MTDTDIIAELKRDRARAESARIAVLAENEYLKTQRRYLEDILRDIEAAAQKAKTPMEGVYKGVSEGVVLCPHCHAPFQHAWDCGMHALHCKAT